MSTGTGIEWTEATWNPVTGCDWVSPGCDHCYARTLAKRMKAMGNVRYQKDGFDRALKTTTEGFGLTLHMDKLTEPLRWTKPRVVFVNSMSDLFHEGVDDDFIEQVWNTMADTPRHTYQILTKRPRRMLQWTRERETRGHPPLPNVWLGTSVENQDWANKRVPLLLETPAAVRFLSCEPLLGSIDLSGLIPDRNALAGPPVVHWVIVGGESGPHARPMDGDWVRALRDQCVERKVDFFFKQWGGRTPKAGGRELDGRLWDQIPISSAEDAAVSAGMT
jgi:protein gp37